MTIPTGSKTAAMRARQSRAAGPFLATYFLAMVSAPMAVTQDDRSTPIQCLLVHVCEPSQDTPDAVKRGQWTDTNRIVVIRT
jgi:hypothetical protein